MERHCGGSRRRRWSGSATTTRRRRLIEDSPAQAQGVDPERVVQALAADMEGHAMRIEPAVSSGEQQVDRVFGAGPELLAQVHPFGLDASSRLESAPGVKELRKVKALIDATNQLST